MHECPPMERKTISEPVSQKYISDFGWKANFLIATTHVFKNGHTLSQK